jgi:hypothetical protein
MITDGSSIGEQRRRIRRSSQTLVTASHAATSRRQAMSEPHTDLSPVNPPEPDPDVDPAHEDRGSELGDFRRYGVAPSDEEFEALVERRTEGTI